MKRITLILLFLTMVSTSMVFSSIKTNAPITKTLLDILQQDPPILPVGTVLYLKASSDIYAKNFKAGDNFFVTLDKDLLYNNAVLIPKGTLVQMQVRQSSNDSEGASAFGVTVRGFIIGNYLYDVYTETKLVTTKDKPGSSAKTASIGIGVGAAFGGISGAGRGAAVGEAAGSLSKGTNINFPAGTEAAFKLVAPLKVSWR